MDFDLAQLRTEYCAEFRAATKPTSFFFFFFYFHQSYFEPHTSPQSSQEDVQDLYSEGTGMVADVPHVVV